MPTRATGSVVEYVLEPLPIDYQLDGLAERAGSGLLRLDFRYVEFLTSMVLANLVSLDKRMQNAGGSLEIVNVNAEMYDVFLITRLNTVLDVRVAQADGGSFTAKSA